VYKFIEIECEVKKRKMYVIIFSIDKNYELYQELEEARKMVVFRLPPRNSTGALLFFSFTPPGL